MAGIPRENVALLPAHVVRRKGLTIKMVRRMKHTYPRAIRMVQAGLVDVESLITHTYPLERIGEAFETVAAYGAATRIEQIVLLPAIGLNVAALTLSAQNGGAGRYDRVRTAIRTALAYGGVIMIAGMHDHDPGSADHDQRNTHLPHQQRRDGGHGRLLDPDLRDSRGTRHGGRAGQRPSRQECPGTQERCDGLRVAEGPTQCWSAARQLSTDR